jgi:ubiquinone biosynthesis protein
VMERLLDRGLVTLIGLGLGFLAVLMLGTAAGPVLAGTEVRLLEVFGWFALFASAVLLLRVLLVVLRPAPGRPPGPRRT